MADRDDPVIVGGIGGSGTRAVAAVLRACGLQLPGPLNKQLDSEWVTLLFKRPGWLELLWKGSRPAGPIVDAGWVLRAMFNGARLEHEQLAILGAAAAEAAALGYDPRERDRFWAPPTPFRLVQDYLAGRHAAVVDERWGWKEPVSQVMLPELLVAFPGARYVHVVRHPLDVAWSANRQGIALWGRLCGIDESRATASPHNAQLAWWIYTNERVAAAGRELGDRFKLVRFEAMCADPLEGARSLASFAGLEPNEKSIHDAAGHVQAPESIGRWREHGLDAFDPVLLKQVEDWIQ